MLDLARPSREFQTSASSKLDEAPALGCSAWILFPPPALGLFGLTLNTLRNTFTWICLRHLKSLQL